MRAGEHHVLQTLCAEPQPAIVLTSSCWMPVLRGELRLFAGGISFETEHHGPHTLPFRIHLAAVGVYRLDDTTTPGLLMLRQKPDAHGYGPIALLPEQPGGRDTVDLDAPPLRTLSLALVIPPRSHLQRALVDTVWPLWETLFRGERHTRFCRCAH